MTRFLRKSLLYVMIITLICNIFAISVAATAKEDIDSADKVICIVHRGDWHAYPENSAQAVGAGIQYGFVSVDLKITKDKKVVLMADDTTDRMVVDAQGATVSGPVSEKTLEELTSLYLRAENGSQTKAKTDCHVAGLADALTEVPENTFLVLNTTCADFETVYSQVKQLNAADKVFYRFNTDSTSDIVKTVAKYDDVSVSGNYQGNIIFMATSAVDKSLANGMNIIELGSANENGVLYDEFLMERFDEKGKAMASMVNGRCGGRPDNERGWDDLIARGYSVIETDYPEKFAQYLLQTDEEKKSLNYYIDTYNSTDLTPYTTDSEKAFTQALAQAKEVSLKASSLSEIQNARHSLQSSYDVLTIGEKKAVTLKFDFTVGRAIALVLCGGAIIAAQIFFFKKRDKSKK